MRMDLDITTFLRRTQRMQARVQTAHERTLRRVMHDTMAEIIAKTGRDTNRMARGYELAANKAGVGPFPVSTVKTAKTFEEARRKLEAQVSFWENILRSRYERIGRNDRWRAQTEKNVARAKKQLASLTRHSIVFDLYTPLGTTTGKRGAAKLATVRSQIYGGDGRMIVTKDSATCIIINKEPHVRMIETRTRVAAVALAKARVLGVRRQRTTYRDAINGR